MLNYQNNQLFCEKLPVADIAKQAGTPFYIYSAEKFRANFNEYKTAFASHPTKICFAVKSNSNIAVIKLLGFEGAGADTVSEGEIRRALLAGINPEKIVFSGVGKTKEEIAFALDSNVGQLNIESPEEIEIINDIAKSKNIRVNIAIRVNPDVDAKTHEKISTGRKSDKFGIPWDEVRGLYNKAKGLSNLNVHGIATHIGSQIITIEPFKAAFAKIIDLAKELNANGFNIKNIDFGGGLGIKYKDEQVIPVKDYAKVILDLLKDTNFSLTLEPGRSISASAGAVITEVQFIKHAGGRSFAVIDAGMNDLARPAIYGSYHDIINVSQNSEKEIYDIVGPVCESSDIFGRERTLSKINPGDLLAIKDAGAYGASMASTYNTRGLLPEILVDGDKFTEIRRRQKFEEIIALEKY